MTEIKVKYRTWYRGLPPRPIKLQIPGWAGQDRNHSSGAKPQPWHCPPFVEGSTYGFELIYNYKNECRVKRVGEEIIFEGDFSSEDWSINEYGKTISGDDEKRTTPPMMTFASGHYGMSSQMDLEPPEGYVTRTEPHPRFYTDDTGTCPILLPGHLQRWWSRIFFVVFKAPREGEVHIFRPGEPYGQVLFVPQKINTQIVQMTEEESHERERRDRRISDHGHKIATHVWTDHVGLTFDDKYKVLNAAYNKGGYKEVDNKISEKILISSKKVKSLKTKIPKRFFVVKKNETLQNKKIKN